MRNQPSLSFALAIGLALSLASLARAGERCCAHCGCGACQKTCRLVCEQKKVNITCWGHVCEDFCLGGPSHPGCRHCEEVCESCDVCDPKVPFALAKPFSWTDWIPNCSAHMYTKKKLMKKTITKTVPSFKWVVEDLCEKCQTKVQSAELPPGTPAPAPPPVAAKRIP